jgi:hypothetical protein
MDLKEPIAVYTANSNLEAHMIATMLNDSGVPAFAVEDQSGASLWMFGTIGQIHRPKIWVDKPTETAARQLIQDFEDRRRERRNRVPGTDTIPVQCEKCGETSLFPDTQNGTVQNCPKCDAYVDVGALDWDEDFGETSDSR